MAPAGLEPTAYGLGNRRSIHLSYGASILSCACSVVPPHSIPTLVPFSALKALHGRTGEREHHGENCRLLEGGRVVEKSDGAHVYYIRKRIGGRLYEVSSGCTVLKAALGQWQRSRRTPRPTKRRLRCRATP